MPKLMLLLVVLFAVGCGTVGGVPGPGRWSPLEYAPAPVDNPLKGFIPYRGTHDFPHSMEFSYFSFAEVMVGADEFDFDGGVEPFLEEIAGRGNQALIRFYLDYPGQPPGVPGWLVEEGVELHPYEEWGGGLSPDYDHPAVVEAMEGFIAAFGERYDGDPRLGVVQVGLLGHWGEWHTWPRVELFPSVETQNRVLAAWDRALTVTQFGVSQDAMGQEPPADFHLHRVGFHDDAFVNGTLPPPDWKFHARTLRFGFADRWKELPVGGELLPGLQGTVWDDPPEAPEDYRECVETTRASWLLNHAPFVSDWPEEKRLRAEEGARLLGYELHAEAFRFAPGEGRLEIRVTNRGVAPFYHDWPGEVALLGPGMEVLASLTAGWDLRGVIPGEGPSLWEVRLPGEWFPLGPGEQVGWRIPGALAGGKALRFANGERTGDWVVLPGSGFPRGR